MANSPYNKNTWEVLDECRQIFENPELVDDSRLQMMEEVWSTISEKMLWHKDGADVPFSRDVAKDFGENPVLAFIGMVKSGVYPPPEFLLLLCFVLDTYFEAGGNTDLEVLFFGHRKPRVGNYSARLAAQRKYSRFNDEFEMAKRLAAKHDIKISAEDAAEHFLSYSNEEYEDQDQKDPIGSFLRGWRRWKEDNKP